MFVIMLATGIWALQLMSVGMVTIMKSLTNLLTISGDYFLYGRTYNIYVWLSLFVITASAIVGAKTDLDFRGWAYVAQLSNCAFTAGYTLMLRGVMDKVLALAVSRNGSRCFLVCQQIARVSSC
jgi:GDP-mannose transporter